MERYLKNWNFIRILRLALGIFIIVEGVTTQEWLFALAGLVFTMLPLLNIGCCSISGCSAPVSKSTKKTDDIIYEEVR
ncbi:hypothetical protein D3C80_887400 [compost metagenome]